MKLIVTGHAGHGKDTVCEYIRDKYKLSFISSSMILLEEVVYPRLKDKYGYKTKEECFKDRDSHRQEWYELLVEYNTPDLYKLGTVILSTYDIYCGLRNIAELKAIKEKGLVDFVIWVDASYRVMPESKASITITKKDCDFSIANNDDLSTLYGNVDILMKQLNYLKFRS